MKGCYYKLLFLNNYFKYFFFHLGDAVGQTGDFIWVQGKEHRKLLKWVEEIYKFKKSLPCTGFHQTSGKFALYSYRAWFEANSSGMKAGKYKPAKQSNAADSLIEAQLLFVVYRHIKVTTLDVLFSTVKCITKNWESKFFLHFKLDHVSRSIHYISPLSFLLAAISGASRSTSPRPATRRERRRCGVTATRRRPALRTSTAWPGLCCASSPTAECPCAETNRSFPQWEFRGRFGACRGQATSLRLCSELSCLALHLGLC